MKFRFLAFVAMMLGMVSCQSDFDEVFVNGGDEVNFTLSVDAADIGITRAGVDAAADNKMAANSAYGAIDYLQGVERSDALRDDWDDVNLRYTLEVYEANDRDDYSAPVKVKDRMVQIIDEYAPVSFDLRLIANRKYHFVVFADFVPESVTDATQGKSVADQANLGIHHTIGATLADITVKADAINDETTDAYFAAEDITISNSMAQTVILKRPYGKLRVIATDLAELNLNADPAKVVVSYDAAHPTKFNALTGSIDFEQTTTTVDFTSTYNAGIGKQSLDNHFYTEYYDDKALFSITNAEGEQRHTHMTLFTDYILAKDEQSDIQFTMTTYDGKGGLIKEVEFSTQIPIQRNYLTTIIGNVLTTATQLEVKINDNFDNEIVITDVITGTPPNNEIWYTTIDGRIMYPWRTESFNAKIVSNTYSDGKGIIKFEQDVTCIGYQAFLRAASNSAQPTNIVIPETVCSIGESAFERCSELTQINMPDGIKSIPKSAFSGCSKLRSFTIPESVTSIGYGAFYNCKSLTSITIPDQVAEIGDCPFVKCENMRRFNSQWASSDGRCLIVDGKLLAFAPTGLTDYIIPSNVTEIAPQVFNGCLNLTFIKIPENVKTIGALSFYNCQALKSVVIDYGVKTIGANAFYGCSNLDSLVLPDSIQSLETSAFSNCTSLVEMYIPGSITTFGSSIFVGCKNLIRFIGPYASNDGRCLIVNGVLNTFLPKNLTEYSIPDNVFEIGERSFRYCTELNKVNIPNSVTKIGDNAFDGCSTLREVVMSDNIVEIGNYAFDNNINLGIITFPEGLLSIGYSAFSETNLKSVVLPSTLLSIGSDAFALCRILHSVYCKAVTPPKHNQNGGNQNIFWYNASGFKIYVPTESVDQYKNTFGWKGKVIEGYDF